MTTIETVNVALLGKKDLLPTLEADGHGPAMVQELVLIRRFVPRASAIIVIYVKVATLREPQHLAALMVMNLNFA